MGTYYNNWKSREAEAMANDLDADGLLRYMKAGMLSPMGIALYGKAFNEPLIREMDVRGVSWAAVAANPSIGPKEVELILSRFFSPTNRIHPIGFLEVIARRGVFRISPEHVERLDDEFAWPRKKNYPAELRVIGDDCICPEVASAVVVNILRKTEGSEWRDGTGLEYILEHPRTTPEEVERLLNTGTPNLIRGILHVDRFRRHPRLRHFIRETFLNAFTQEEDYNVVDEIVVSKDQGSEEDYNVPYESMQAEAESQSIQQTEKPYTALDVEKVGFMAHELMQDTDLPDFEQIAKELYYKDPTWLELGVKLPQVTPEHLQQLPREAIESLLSSKDRNVRVKAITSMALGGQDKQSPCQNLQTR